MIEMNQHVFISHAHDDKASAELILQVLEKRGVKCWIAPRDAQPSASGIRDIKPRLKPSGTTYLIAAISKADLR
jgi:hypothetical protein